ncbi:MAG: gfo/Idh/MocA family oxidoreductase, partial [Gemmatimonadetes bacterium]|nr:gfo/Idh/MocA family oxidoreductase [Gemmatimonadota bacterium]
IYCDAEVESKATLYRDGDYEGEDFDCFDVAGGRSNWEAFGFRDKNREFIDSIRTGTEVTSSPFRDCLKTMQIAEKILAQALMSDA